jgi:hypothetical protein
MAANPLGAHQVGTHKPTAWPVLLGAMTRFGVPGVNRHAYACSRPLGLEYQILRARSGAKSKPKKLNFSRSASCLALCFVVLAYLSFGR